MNKNMKYLYLLILAIIFSMCNHANNSSEKNIEHGEIDSVFITYLPKLVDSDVKIGCDVLATIQSKHPINNYLDSSLVQFVDTFIVDSLGLKKIHSLIDKKEPIADFEIDTRMYVTIKYKNKYVDSICLGGIINLLPPNGKFNGKSYTFSNELIYL